HRHAESTGTQVLVQASPARTLCRLVPRRPGSRADARLLRGPHLPRCGFARRNCAGQQSRRPTADDVCHVGSGELRDPGTRLKTRLCEGNPEAVAEAMVAFQETTGRQGILGSQPISKTWSRKKEAQRERAAKPYYRLVPRQAEISN